MQKENP